MIELIAAVLVLFALCWIFEHAGLKVAIIFSLIDHMAIMYFNNMEFSLVNIIIGIVVTVVETSILYAVYRKSNSFLGFLGRSFLLGVIL